MLLLNWSEEARCGETADPKIEKGDREGGLLSVHCSGCSYFSKLIDLHHGVLQYGYERHTNEGRRRWWRQRQDSISGGSRRTPRTPQRVESHHQSGQDDCRLSGFPLAAQHDGQSLQHNALAPTQEYPQLWNGRIAGYRFRHDVFVAFGGATTRSAQTHLRCPAAAARRGNTQDHHQRRAPVGVAPNLLVLRHHH